MILNDQFETYIIDVRSNGQFFSLKGIGNHAQKKMVKIKKHIVYPLVYLLVKLTLILLLATTIVESTFSAMNIVKSKLQN